jgi:mono/diheme cytochrome c family protein
MHTSPLRVLTRSAVAGAALLAAITVTAPSAAAQGQVDWNSYRKQVEQAPRDTVPQNVYQGWKQFELNCARCHGEYAVGTSFAPALVQSLKDGGPVPTKEAFIQTVCAGRPDKGMPSWCQLGLEMEKIENIYAYVKGRADGKIRVGRPAVKPEG